MLVLTWPAIHTGRVLKIWVRCRQLLSDDHHESQVPSAGPGSLGLVALCLS